MKALLKKNAPTLTPTIIGLMFFIILHSQSMHLANHGLIIDKDAALRLLGSLSALVFSYLGIFAFKLMSSGIKSLFRSLTKSQEVK